MHGNRLPVGRVQHRARNLGKDHESNDRYELERGKAHADHRQDHRELVHEVHSVPVPEPLDDLEPIACA